MISSFPAPVHGRPRASVDPWVLSKVLTNQQPREKSETNMVSFSQSKIRLICRTVLYLETMLFFPSFFFFFFFAARILLFIFYFFSFPFFFFFISLKLFFLYNTMVTVPEKVFHSFYIFELKKFKS